MIESDGIKTFKSITTVVKGRMAFITTHNIYHVGKACTDFYHFPSLEIFYCTLHSDIVKKKMKSEMKYVGHSVVLIIDIRSVCSSLSEKNKIQFEKK